ncbi:hypothetical protein [Micromonospora chalcea]|uniref:hypothetical protein n=1 Tax=Micromonospora chalcea TaxID=1874 RepID=UPI003D7198EA
MPKETINDVASLYDVQVSWRPNPAGYVQLGIETHDGRSIIDHLAVTDEQAAAGGTPPAFNGLWGSLDRDGVNRLIRVLRRARDNAYGADA